MRFVGQSSFRAHPGLETSLSHDALHPLYSFVFPYIYIYIYIIYIICSFIFPFSLVKLRLTVETVALDSGRPGTEFTLCCY